MIGRPFKDHVHALVHDYLMDRPDAIRSGSKLVTVEYKTLDGQERPRWYQWRFHGILDENGELSEIQCVGRDVTSSRLCLKETEAQKERYRQLAEMTSDWLWEVDLTC